MQKLSVLVPVYNVEKYIKRCVDSLKNQTYKNLEIIFVDDCSTDNSLNILKEEIKDMPNAKILQHDENKGLFLARLTALLDCTGDYIAFLDSDDYVDHNFYETYMKVITEEDADMCLCQYKYVNGEGINYNYPKPFADKINLQGQNCFNYLSSIKKVDDGFITLWCKIIKRRLFDETKVDLINIAKQAKHLIGGEDSVYTTIFSSKTQKLVSGSGALLYYYQHPEQSIVKNSKEKILSNLESHIRSIIIARDYAIKHGLYSSYLEYDEWWITFTISNYFKHALKYKCVNEYNDLLKKYNFDKIASIVTYTSKILKN